MHPSARLSRRRRLAVTMAASLALGLMAPLSAGAAPAANLAGLPAVAAPDPASQEWFRDTSVGAFIHWGPMVSL